MVLKERQLLLCNLDKDVADAKEEKKHCGDAHNRLSGREGLHLCYSMTVKDS